MYEVGAGGVSTGWRQLGAGGDLRAVRACLLAFGAV